MAHLFQSLLLLIATASKNELARQIKYLKVENEILRSKLPGRITVTGKERSRLVRFAKNLGTAIFGLATIVTPQTVMRWLKEDREGKHLTPVTRTSAHVVRDLSPGSETSQGEQPGLYANPGRASQTGDSVYLSQYRETDSSGTWV